ncbi:MAG: SUMF1/EgtB/PvdO family nonheme iron enzyme [Kiritimatiellae bacterium]|nr:SUMF1/EgtB/PvdO family nonheme iron enzyme [Kiritimatiellia bacterium]
MSKLIIVAAVAASAAIPMSANAGEPSITVNSAAQRWPWNNKIDVTYTVTNGQDRAAGLYCGVEFTITDGGRSHVLHGYTVGASAEGDADGTTHSVVLTAPSGIRSANCTISATLFTTNVPSGNDYMIVNLASGEIYYEGLMDTQDASHARYNVAEYKEGKMVLRKVPKWADRASLPNAAALASLSGYPTGDDVNFASTNKRKYWPTAKDYYIGVFMVTQKQYTNLGLSNPSEMTKAKTGDVVAHRPVDKVAYCYRSGVTYIRDNASPAVTITASSNGTFLQRLNYKTGLYFDLPTEAMFEIAQRAGATTAYSWGDDPEKVPDYCICSENCGGTSQAAKDLTCALGSKLPNEWGLYDTAGNVWEWCRDSANLTNLGNATDDAFTPASGSTNYRIRGFGTAADSKTSTSFRASHRSYTGNGAGWNRSFRVSHVVED